MSRLLHVVVALVPMVVAADAMAQRMALPGPRPGPGSYPGMSPLGRTGTLLGRPGTLLPAPTPRPAPAPRPDTRPDMRLDMRPDTRPGQGNRPDRTDFPSRIDGNLGVPGVVGTSGVHGVVGSSGVTIDGNFVGDRGRVAFHVGQPTVLANGRLARVVPFRRFPHFYPGWWSHRYWPYGYAYSNYWDYGNSYVYGTGGAYVDPYVTQGQLPAPAQSAAAAPTLTTVEKAQAALQRGDGKSAVRFFREHLRATPDDTAAMRLLAIAYVDDKQFDEAAAVMAMAYEKEPVLARTPMDEQVLGGDSEALRRRVLAAVTYANRVDTASSWVLVASLMQAEGRDQVAKSNIAKAKAKGLSVRVASEFDASLGK